MRPRRLVVVVGTGTEIGKTWVAARLLQSARATGHTVAARKPAQSFDPGDDPGSLDAQLLATASGEDPETVCPPARSYPVAMAPPMAAQALGLPSFTLADLVGGLDWPTPAAALGLVETAGGVRSPQADDGDAVGLAARLGPDVIVLVADAGLGTLNGVRLSVDALGTLDASTSPRLAVVLNRFDPTDALHRANRDWLVARDGLMVFSSPGELGALVDWVLA